MPLSEATVAVGPAPGVQPTPSTAIPSPTRAAITRNRSARRGHCHESTRITRCYTLTLSRGQGHLWFYRLASGGRRDAVRLPLMALLAKEPAHGYELKSRLEQIFGEAYPAPNIGQVYLTLQRLERAG